MRKIKPLIISILTPFLSLVAPSGGLASAQVVTNAGETAWSVEEMSAFKAEVEAEREAICGTDTNCKIDLYFEQMSRGGIYSALDYFANRNIILTAINPERGTLRLLFHDEDQEMALWTGTAVHYPLTELYVVWFGPELTGHIYYVDEIRAGHDVAGLHVVYAADLTTEEPGWFPADVEVEISAPDAALSQNTDGMLYFSMTNQPLGSSGGFDSYRNCLESPDYGPGMECRIFYRANGPIFLPVSIDEPVTEEPITNEPDDGLVDDVPVDNPTDNSIDEPDDIPVDNPIGNPIDSPIDNSTDTPVDDSSSTDAPVPESTDADFADASNDNQIADSSIAPTEEPVVVESTQPTQGIVAQPSNDDTKSSDNQVSVIVYQPANRSSGAVAQASSSPRNPITASTQDSASVSDAATTENTSTDSATVDKRETPDAITTTTLPLSGVACEKETIFPWWFIILVLICDALLLWLFWPNRKNRQKIEKSA